MPANVSKWIGENTAIRLQAKFLTCCKLMLLMQCVLAHFGYIYDAHLYYKFDLLMCIVKYCPFFFNPPVGLLMIFKKMLLLVDVIIYSSVILNKYSFACDSSCKTVFCSEENPLRFAF